MVDKNTRLNVLWVIPCKPGSPLDLISARRGVSVLGENGIDVFQYDFHSSRTVLGFIMEYLKIRRICRDKCIDIVHAQFGSTTALMAFLIGLPYFITFRGTDLNGDPDSVPGANLLRRFLGNLTSQFAKKVILVSRPMQRHLLKLESKIAIIPSGTEERLFFPKDRNQCRERLNLDLKRYYISFASGGGRTLKRPDLALAVVESLKKTGYDIELLEIWKVPHEKVSDYLNASNVTILTSEREGSPNIVRESIACGVPVVSFDVGDVRDWIELDDTSFVVQYGDLKSMVESVKYLLDHPTSHTRKVDINLFSERSSAVKLSELYKKNSKIIL